MAPYSCGDGKVASTLVQPEASSHPSGGALASELASDKLYWIQ